MINFKLLPIFILLLFHNNLSAQISTSKIQSLAYSERINDQIANRSVENNSSSLTYTIGVPITAVLAAMLIDNQSRVNEKITNNSLLDAGHSYGDFKYNLGLSGILYLTQFLFENNKMASTGKVLFESLLVGGLASISIKYIFGRSRPYRERGTTDFNWFETENIKNSLPSGHVITAFTTSTVLSKSIDNVYTSVFLYGLASLTAYQRIASDNHWFSDVVLGASIGVLTGEYFSLLNEKDKKNNGNYKLIPFFTKRTVGVNLYYRF